MSFPVHALKCVKRYEYGFYYREKRADRRDQLDHLISHYTVVRGDNEVVRAAKALQGKIFSPVHCLEKILAATPYGACSNFSQAHSTVD